MIFEDVKISITCLMDAVPAAENDEEHLLNVPPWIDRTSRFSGDRHFWGNETIQEANNFLSDAEEFEDIAMLIYEARKTEFDVVVATDLMERLTPSRVLRVFKKYLKEFLREYKVHDVEIKYVKEVTPLQACKLIRIADDKNRYTTYNNDWFRNGLFGDEDFNLNYDKNEDFSIKDKIFSAESLSQREALAQTEKLMMDQSFTDEIRRIYSSKHPKRFAGIPVHYVLKVKNSQGVLQMAELLCRALYKNHRIVGRCINRISNLTDRAFYDTDIENIFRQAAGNTIIIEMHGSNEDHENYASTYHRVVKYFSGLILRYQRDTQFILVEETDNTGFAPKLISSVQEEIHLVELKEGAGNRAVALEYLKNLAAEAELLAYSEADLEQAMGDRVTFRPSDINAIFENLRRDNLRNNIYVDYKNADRLKIARNQTVGNDAYAALQEMIGLTEVKKLLDQIIANFKIQKTRSRMSLNRQKMSMHMVFTGNPGTAKTTVSRLLAQILSKEGVLDTGNYVECGRAHLIGEYVGQTAPKVRHRFTEARGGILMIDEAYSLVDDYRNSYGDEAISTIVQEMENRREDTIVIFCGYPDKMKDFLKRNEGLRSRIAFQIDFPDYSAEELVQILRLMAKNDGYEISPEIEDKCRKIFAAAGRKKDFGNGRFVRNLWEQAKLAQSSRICNENAGKEIDREILLQMKPEDFNVNAAEKYGQDEKSIGFNRK